MAKLVNARDLKSLGKSSLWVRFPPLAFMKLEFLEHPEYVIAHPDCYYINTFCDLCALVIRPDTGEIVLLWRCGGEITGNWSVSRNMPNYKRHRKELYDSLTEFEINGQNHIKSKCISKNESLYSS